jgi:hypothetical protein
MEQDYRIGDRTRGPDTGTIGACRQWQAFIIFRPWYSSAKGNLITSPVGIVAAPFGLMMQHAAAAVEFYLTTVV